MLFIIFYVVILCRSLIHSQDITCGISSSCNNINDQNVCLSMFYSCISKCIGMNSCSIELEKGEFHWTFNSSENSVKIHNIHNLSILGSTIGESKIIIHGLHGAFSIGSCNNFTIKNIIFDMYRVPFTLGKVTNINNQTGHIKLTVNESQYAFPTDPILNDTENYSFLMNIQSILGFDNIEKHPINPDISNRNFNPDTSIISAVINTTDPTNSYIIFQTNNNNLQKIKHGMYLIIRHQVNGYNFIYTENCIDIYFQNVTVYSIPGVGFFSLNCTNIDLFKVNILRINNRALSVNAGATNFIMTKGNISVNECIFEGQGDDGMNIHNDFLRIVSKVSANSLYLEFKQNRTINNLLNVYDIYEFRHTSNYNNSLQPYFYAKLININSNNNRLIFNINLKQLIYCKYYRNTLKNFQKFPEIPH
eukprot:551434_1